MKQLAAIVVIGLALTGCGGNGDSATADPPAATATPTSVSSGLPPEFLACMADQGYPMESADEVHSAPQAVLQECFSALHEGGGAP